MSGRSPKNASVASAGAEEAPPCCVAQPLANRPAAATSNGASRKITATDLLRFVNGEKSPRRFSLDRWRKAWLSLRFEARR
jgi:hypothetical protein